jgi:hypothetical protein
LLERRRRVDQALFAVIMEAYLHGVSTRKVDDVVKALGIDSGISKSEVSRICADLDVEVGAFRDCCDARSRHCTGGVAQDASAARSTGPSHSAGRGETSVPNNGLPSRGCCRGNQGPSNDASGPSGRDDPHSCSRSRGTSRRRLQRSGIASGGSRADCNAPSRRRRRCEGDRGSGPDWKYGASGRAVFVCSSRPKT